MQSNKNHSAPRLAARQNGYFAAAVPSTSAELFAMIASIAMMGVLSAGAKAGARAGKICAAVFSVASTCCVAALAAWPASINSNMRSAVVSQDVPCTTERRAPIICARRSRLKANAASHASTNSCGECAMLMMCPYGWVTSVMLVLTTGSSAAMYSSTLDQRHGANLERAGKNGRTAGGNRCRNARCASVCTSRASCAASRLHFARQYTWRLAAVTGKRTAALSCGAPEFSATG